MLARNELAEAEIHLQAAQPALEANNEYNYLAPLWWGLAKLYTARGNLFQVQEEYERILNRWKATEDALLILPILLDGIVSYADVGDLMKARLWLTGLESVMQTTDNPVGVAALLEAQGMLKAAEGKLEEAIPLLRRAVEVWSNLKRHYQHAQASQHLAEMLLRWARKYSTGRGAAQIAREEADMLLDSALVVYECLQVPTSVQTIQSLRSSTHLEAQQKRRNTLEARQNIEGLTSREMQVLIQVATGHTNKEIAIVLSISIGTVELHVSHILNKLGCETRTQAATYALTKGWVKN